MKTILTGLLLILATSYAANAESPIESGPLDGKRFCRTVNMGGMFGQPQGPRQHCLSFAEGLARDDANTFFGNPPETFAYDLIDGVLVNLYEGKATSYALIGRNLVIVETGAVLKPVR